jgi:putative ABC transport system permease protein
VTRSLGSMLYGVTPLDPATLVIAPAALVLAAGLAAVAPARRATRVDPVIALRRE